MTFTHALSTNNYGPAKFIVDASAANGTHTTIATALTSASSGDTIFIRPGTYTEDLTLKAGVNLTAYSCDQSTPNVTIVGKATATFAGSCTIGDIRLQTNSDFLLVVSGSSATIVHLNRCFLNISNNTAISFTSSSASSQINLNYCKGDVGTTGIAIFAHSGAGNLRMSYTEILGSGSSVTNNTLSGTGGLAGAHCEMTTPITTSSTSLMALAYCSIICANATALTANSTNASNQIYMCRIGGGTAVAITLGASAVLQVSVCTISSFNTNTMTGTGTVKFDMWTNDNAGENTVSTVTPQVMRYGYARSAQQPAFLAYLTTTVTNVSGDGTLYTVIFDTEVYDQGANFTLASSTFTAPFTGRYYLSFAALVGGGTIMNPSNYIINTSNRTYLQAGAPVLGGTQTISNTFFSAFADMDAADTAVFQFQSTDTGGKIDDIFGLNGGHLGTYCSGILSC